MPFDNTPTETVVVLSVDKFRAWLRTHRYFGHVGTGWEADQCPLATWITEETGVAVSVSPYSTSIFYPRWATFKNPTWMTAFVALNDLGLRRVSAHTALRKLRLVSWSTNTTETITVTRR